MRKWRNGFAALSLSASLAGGCSHDTPYERRQDRIEERREHRKEAAEEARERHEDSDHAPPRRRFR